MKSGSAPALSIIIPTTDEAPYIRRLLKSIKRQDFRDYEVIISDSQSTDGTREIAREYGCIVIDGERKGPGYARNLAASYAKGDYLFFMDADVELPSSDFLSKIMEKAESMRAPLFALYSFPYDGIPAYRLLYSIVNIALRIAEWTKDPHAPGYAIFCTKNAFKGVNGFNEGLRNGEDHDLARRLWENGSEFRVIKDPHILVSTRRLQERSAKEIVFLYLKAELAKHLRGEDVPLTYTPGKKGR